MKYAIIGAGNIGRALIADLLTADPQAQVLALDTAASALDQVCELGEAGQVHARLLQHSDLSHEIAGQLRGAAGVANTTVGERCVDILRAAIEARVPYVDVHGILFNERVALSGDARDAGITALLGMGVSPGLTNMLAADGVRRASGEITVECEYVTHRPLNPSLGLLETALRQFRNGTLAPVYEDGELRWYPPFSGSIRTRFPRLADEVELVYTPHSEPETIPYFIPGLKRVSVRGTYLPAMMTLLKSLHAFGLLDPALQVSVPSGAQPFQPLLRAALMSDGSLKPAEVTSLYTMRVRVIGEVGSDRSVSEVVVGHEPGWDPLPQGRLTALPASFALQLLARKALDRPGVISPELLSGAQVEQCIRYLEGRGLWVERHEYHEDRGHPPETAAADRGLAAQQGG